MSYLFINLVAISLCLAESSASLYELPPFHKTSQQSRFEPTLKNIQKMMSERIEKMKNPKTLALPVSIETELKNLESFFHGMDANPVTRRAISHCSLVFKKAKKDLTSCKSEELQRNVLFYAWQEIGQLIYLADHFPEEISSFINPKWPQRTRQWVRERCVKEMKRELIEVETYFEQNHKSGLQDPAIATSIYKSKTIAKMLVTFHGKLNLGMIPLIEEFFLSKTDFLEYETGMARVLSSMNGSWQSALDKIVKPVVSNFHSEGVIRADLDLTPDEPITDLHSKWTAIMGLVSQLNQGASSDCFSVAWAIKKHNEYFLRSLSDYGELLKNGYLSRGVNGTIDQFFFKNSLADGDLLKPLILKSTGEVVLGHMHLKLWEIPGIAAACKQMGIENIEENFASALRSLLRKGDVKTNPKEIILAFAAHISNKKQSEKDYHFLIGRYGFSITQNHLLRAWETALAGTAEAQNGTFIRDQIVVALRKAIGPYWKQIEATLPIEKQPLMVEMETALEKKLNSLNRFVYNDAIPMNHIAADGNSTEGGFELYKRNPNQIASMGNRIDSPADFANYLIEVIEKTTAKLQEEAGSDEDRTIFSYLKKEISFSILKKEFLNDVLWAYDDANMKDPDPVLNYRNLEKTPMTSIVGADPFDVQEIDTGLSFQPYSKSIKPKNPYMLIQWILDLARWKEDSQHYLEDDSDDELDLAANPEHAFTIAFEEKDLSSFVRSKKTSSEWIQERVLSPNQFVAHTQIDVDSKAIFSQNLMRWIENDLKPVPSRLSYLQANISAINGQNMTIEAYGRNFYRIVEELLKEDLGTDTPLSLIFDTLFLQSLPKEIISQISASAISFAKTNWNDRDKNIYFCTFFNPRTASLSFGMIDEDRTQLQILDAEEWIDQKEWTVIPIETLKH